MQLRLDRERCQGHGRCYVLAPALFGADDDGYGYVLVDSVDAAFESQARAALINCPEDAIIIVGPVPSQDSEEWS
jgi:ferredoxin